MEKLPTINPGKTGQRISEMISNAGYTPDTLANELGFSSAQSIYKWRRGACLPKVDNLLILSRLLHCRIDDLIVSED